MPTSPGPPFGPTIDVELLKERVQLALPPFEILLTNPTRPVAVGWMTPGVIGKPPSVQPTINALADASTATSNGDPPQPTVPPKVPPRYVAYSSDPPPGATLMTTTWFEPRPRARPPLAGRRRRLGNRFRWCCRRGRRSLPHQPPWNSRFRQSLDRCSRVEERIADRRELRGKHAAERRLIRTLCRRERAFRRL